MGEEVDSSDAGDSSGELEIGWSDARPMAEELATRFSFANADALEGLLDRLFGYSCRDQYSAIDPSTLGKRRSRGYELAAVMRDEAQRMLASLNKIHEAMLEFNHETVQFHPGLLEVIFDVSTGGPGQLCLPQQIAILQTFFPDPEEEAVLREMLGDEAPPPSFSWDEVADKISLLAALPVRAQRTRGPVPNVLLQKALSDLRHYWESVEGRSWTMSSLKHRVTREDNLADNLQGHCEQFVAAALQAAGLRFSLADLSSAWTAIDGKRERGAGSAS